MATGGLWSRASFVARALNQQATHENSDAGQIGWFPSEAAQEVETESQNLSMPLEDLLHPVVRAAAHQQFMNGHYRDAVFNAIVSVFDLLRERSKLALDGSKLASEAFGVNSPRLLVADITTETGRSDQLGFMQMLQGAYGSIRNPKAHTLQHETTRPVAAQYLVFASLLARRISEATLVSR
jgi:uncharacterized protein (TIGR02391 family)